MLRPQPIYSSFAMKVVMILRIEGWEIWHTFVAWSQILAVGREAQVEQLTGVSLQRGFVPRMCECLVVAVAVALLSFGGARRGGLLVLLALLFVLLLARRFGGRFGGCWFHAFLAGLLCGADVRLGLRRVHMIGIVWSQENYIIIS